MRETCSGFTKICVDGYDIVALVIPVLLGSF